MISFVSDTNNLTCHLFEERLCFKFIYQSNFIRDLLECSFWFYLFLIMYLDLMKIEGLTRENVESHLQVHLFDEH